MLLRKKNPIYETLEGRGRPNSRVTSRHIDCNTLIISIIGLIDSKKGAHGTPAEHLATILIIEVEFVHSYRDQTVHMDSHAPKLMG
jgi:hypothetical protein